MSTRFAYGLGLIIVSVLLLTSIYLQFIDGVIPCPLCTLQRLSFTFLGGLFLLGMIFYAKPIARFFIHLLLILTSFLGIGFAGRQIWLQHFSTANTSECGVSLQYLMQALPFNEAMKKIFAGSTECAQQGWTFGYLDMAEWALLWFVLLLGLTLYVALKKR